MNKDGTSVVVANLSAVLQLAGYKCVVVDLNLETPIMHRYFDVKYTKGISDYLSGKENNLEDTIYSTIYPNLDIVPAGNIPSGLNPSELIFSDKVDTMFSRLKEDYDYILIDSAPIGLTSDTINLMKYADINLVVFRANKTKKVAINNLEKLVGKYDIKNVGLILNKTKFSKKSNSYI
jgi:capsular exopolysaccharide synthesis family protein